MQYRLEGEGVPDRRALYMPRPDAIPSLESIQVTADKNMLSFVEAVNALNKHLIAARGHKDPRIGASHLNQVLASKAFTKVHERLNAMGGVAMGRAFAKAKQARGLKGAGSEMITRRDVINKHGELLARIGNRGHPDQESLRADIIAAFNLDNIKVLPEAEKNKLWCWLGAYEPQLLWWMDNATEDIHAIEPGENKSKSKELTMKVLKGLFAEASGNTVLLNDFKDLMAQIHGEDAASDMVFSCTMDEKAREHTSRRPRDTNPEWFSAAASDKDWDACDVSAADRPSSARGSVNGNGWGAGDGSAAGLPSTARGSVNGDGWVNNDGWGVHSDFSDPGPPTPDSVKGWDTCNDFEDARSGSPVPSNNWGARNGAHGAKRVSAGPSTGRDKHCEPRWNEDARAKPDEPTHWELPNGSRSNINHGIVWGHARNKPAHHELGQTSKAEEKRINRASAEIMAMRKKNMEAKYCLHSAAFGDLDREKPARLPVLRGHGHGPAGQVRDVW